MILREYVYVDSDKVSGLAGQLYDGVPQKATNVAARQRQIEANFQFLRGSRGSSKQEHIERTLSDSLFKDLELDLESNGLLEDVSQLLFNDFSSNPSQRAISPGRIIRVTAPGTLFHPTQLSDALVGIATAAQGISQLNDEGESYSPIPPKAKSPGQKKSERAARASAESMRFPEDYLPSMQKIPLLDLPRDVLDGMIKVARSIFGEGVHLHLRPAGAEGPVVSARLEEGRRFLDSSPEVLLSRYGLTEQEWTLVGTVGQIGSKLANGKDVPNIMNSDDSVNRAKFVDIINYMFDHTLGLVDLPQYPGFSVVPLALYRTIGTNFNEIEGA